MSTLAPDTREDAFFTVHGLSAYYGELRALYDISLDVKKGDVLSIIGANGAGKTTLLKSLVGLMNRGAAAHIVGEVNFNGLRLDQMSTEEIVDLGITMVPEGRRLFSRLTVEDNLLTGGYLPRCRPSIKEQLAMIYDLFPRLAERRGQVVSQMSGGEQQMVAIGRALMSDPTVIFFDELSLGLAPAILEDIYRKVKDINAKGVTCIIIEQEMKRALSVANHIVVMLEGSLVLSGKPEDFTEDQVAAAYFGTSTSEVRK